MAVARGALHGGSRTVGALGIAAALACTGCFEVTGMPCPHGGVGCPTGYACVDERCRPVGGDGASVEVNVYLLSGGGVSESEVRSLVFESYRGVGCVLGRDPDPASNEAMGRGELYPDVHAPVSLAEPATVRVPAGSQSMFVRVPREGGGEDVARGCVQRTMNPGEHAGIWVALRRATYECGDGYLDPPEQCDPGEAGAEACSPDCRRSLPIEIHSGACHRSLTAACMEPDDRADGRCLVGWLENGDQVAVDVRNLDGSRDTADRRGVAPGEFWGAGLKVVAIEHRGLFGAAAMWLAPTRLEGVTFNGVGQRVVDFRISAGESSPSDAVATLAALRPGEGSSPPIPIGGWVTASGHATIERVGVEERWEGQLGLPVEITRGAAALVVGSRLFLAWELDHYVVEREGEPDIVDSGAVVGSWVSFPDGVAAPDGPFIVAHDPNQVQSDPAVAVVGSEQVLALWVDANNDHEDRLGTGIRGRTLRPGPSRGEEHAVNSRFEGDQARPSVAGGEGYALATWIDRPTGELRARYLGTSGSPLPLPFGESEAADMTVATGDVVGSAAVVAGDRAYVFWLENDCGDGASGGRVMLRILPRPY